MPQARPADRGILSQNVRTSFLESDSVTVVGKRSSGENDLVSDECTMKLTDYVISLTCIL